MIFFKMVFLTKKKKKIFLQICVKPVCVGSGGGGGDVPFKWVTFGDPRVPTYGYIFGEMSLELGLIFYHHPSNWGPNSVFPAILVIDTGCICRVML